MKLEDIQDLWEIDAKIDKSRVGDIALEVAQLHHKYFKILSSERMAQLKWESEYKVLRLEKQEFFIQGPSEETDAKGWKYPAASGKILKVDIQPYIDADPDLTKLSLRIALQTEKIKFLESILKSINNRNYELRVHVDWNKFINGVN